jgi:hypothetical protein
MSSGPKNFDELQKLLSLKRHEQPPRRFFSRLPDDVLDHLDAPERPETQSWLERLGCHFDVSPAVLGTLAVLVCGLLAVGLSMSLRLQKRGRAPLASGILITNIEYLPLWSQPPAPQELANGTGALNPRSEGDPNSTAPVISPEPARSPFNQFSTGARKVGFNTEPGEQ